MQKEFVRLLRRDPGLISDLRGVHFRLLDGSPEHGLDSDGEIRVVDAVPEGVVAVVAVLELAVALGVDRLEHGARLQDEAAEPDQGGVTRRYRFQRRCRLRSAHELSRGEGFACARVVAVVAAIRPNRRGGPKHRLRRPYLPREAC